jgi:hypothetical protein
METWRITYVNKQHSTRHEVTVEAPTSIIAQRLGWEAFTELRHGQRYGVPLKDDYFVYSVVRDEASVPEGD